MGNQEDDYDEELEIFIEEFFQNVSNCCSHSEFLALLHEAFHEGLFENEIKKFIYSNYSPSVAEDKIREQLTEEITEELREEIRSELEEDGELREQCEEEIADKIRENFESILRGEKDDGEDYEMIFNLAVEELKSILISKKEFMATIAFKIKSEILSSIKSGEVKKEYENLVSKIEEDLKNEMKKDKKIISKLTAEVMNDITESIFDK